MAALKRMRTRNRGTIVNVGSALSYRAIPLQSIYCAARYAVRGFTDALRSELLHDGVAVHLTMVHLAAMNTPQFDWALNKMRYRPQPMPPIFSPEVAARAILFAATHRRREVWVGFPTVKAILAGRFAPGLVDRYLAWTGYSGQLTSEPASSNAPGKLFQSVAGNWGAEGRFVNRERHRSWQTLATRLFSLAGKGSSLPDEFRAAMRETGHSPRAVAARPDPSGSRPSSFKAEV